MSVIYSKTSPYYDTGKYGNFLDVMVNRKLSKQVDDVKYTIDKVYQNRPDLLAFDLYGDANLWWVFVQRNPDVLRDPVFDFLPGVTIYIPKKNTIVNDLGL
jgi:alpha-L-fucosidase